MSDNPIERLEKSENNLEKFMWEEGLCESCKEKSREVGYPDSFCPECHDKYMILRTKLVRSFGDFMKGDNENVSK